MSSSSIHVMAHYRFLPFWSCIVFRCVHIPQPWDLLPIVGYLCCFHALVKCCGDWVCAKDVWNGCFCAWGKCLMPSCWAGWKFYFHPTPISCFPRGSKCFILGKTFVLDYLVNRLQDVFSVSLPALVLPFQTLALTPAFWALTSRPQSPCSEADIVYALKGSETCSTSYS